MKAEISRTSLMRSSALAGGDDLPRRLFARQIKAPGAAHRKTPDAKLKLIR